MTLHEIRAAMEPIVRRAGAYVKSAVPVHANEKSGHADLVTEYDVNTQRMLVRELTALLPEANVMGEEEHLSCDVTKGYCFIIDPIDGTTNFVMGFNHSAVSVALRASRRSCGAAPLRSSTNRGGDGAGAAAT